jgi:TolB protein
MALHILAPVLFAAAATPAEAPAFAPAAERFEPGVVSSNYADIRLTLSPDGRAAMWFSRDRPGGAGGYDVWVSRRDGDAWSTPAPVPFNSPTRDFDPAFSADGRSVFFCSDRPGGAGGDDLYRVALDADGRFGDVEWLGADVNTAGNEWAPMLSPDGRTLLFSSDGHAGAGRMDLVTAQVTGSRFAPARPLAGAINTPDDEFDATLLDDGVTIVFTRAPDLRKDDVALFVSRRAANGEYEPGARLPPSVNTPGGDAFAPMLDWSRPHRLMFTTRRPVDSPDGTDLYVIEYAWKR